MNLKSRVISLFFFSFSQKDERAHTDYVVDLDKQVKRIGKDYEKKSKKDSSVSLNSHNVRQ